MFRFGAFYLLCKKDFSVRTVDLIACKHADISDQMLIEDIDLIGRDPERAAIPFMCMLHRELPDIRIVHQKADDIDRIIRLLSQGI